MTRAITKGVHDLFGKFRRPGTSGAEAARRADLPRSEAAPRISDRVFLRLLLLGSACGAVVFLPRYDVGFFNDDASFVLLAQRLWNYLWTPSGPGVRDLFSHFMPGFPLFLAPFTAAFEPRWAWLRCAVAAVSLLTVYGLWRLLDGWLSAEERRWTCSLYALHPLFLLSSGMVMADPFLACLFVYALLALRLVLEGAKGIWPYALLGSAAAWAAGTKPIGILLPAALTAALLAARAWKGLRLLAVLIWLPCLAAGVAALMRTESPTDYLSYLVQGLASLAQQPLWQRAYNSLHAFLLVYGLACPWPRGPALDLLGAALISGIVYLCAKGLAALLSRPLPVRFVALAAGLLVIGQGLVLSLWTVYSERYALPLLPFGILFLVAGIFSFRRSPLAARALLAAAALGFLGRVGQLALETHSPRRPAETRLFFQTLDWIRSETPPDSRFLGRGAVIELYTGRSGHGIFAAPDADALLLELYRFRITHALVTDQPVLSTQGPYRTNQAWQQAMERAWIRSHPRSFKKLYSNAVEKTEIYRVDLPARLKNAAVFYALAQNDIRNSDWPAAEANLRRSLAAEPDFTSALMALASLTRGRGGAAEAEQLLRRVLALEPNYAKATRALAELLERQGRRREAELVRAEGRAAFRAPPFEAVP